MPTRDARSRLRPALMWLTLLRSCFRRAPSSHPAGAGLAAVSRCPVCEQAAPLLDRLDFNKSCEEARGKRLPLSGTLMATLLDADGKSLASTDAAITGATLWTRQTDIGRRHERVTARFRGGSPIHGCFIITRCRSLSMSMPTPFVCSRS